MGSLTTTPIHHGRICNTQFVFPVYFHSQGDTKQKSMEASHLYNGPC